MRGPHNVRFIISYDSVVSSFLDSPRPLSLAPIGQPQASSPRRAYESVDSAKLLVLVRSHRRAIYPHHDLSSHHEHLLFAKSIWISATFASIAKPLMAAPLKMPNFKVIPCIPCPYIPLDDSIRLLRRLLSIFLLVVFGLSIVSPLFALSRIDATRLPACCRRDGKHHCMENMADRGNSIQSGTQFSTPAEKCPYYPSALVPAHSKLLALPVADAVCASLVSHPAGVAQTESMWRISRDRSRQKRGPPTPSSLV
jgi:hypothetical protein